MAQCFLHYEVILSTLIGFSLWMTTGICQALKSPQKSALLIKIQTHRSIIARLYSATGHPYMRACTHVAAHSPSLFASHKQTHTVANLSSVYIIMSVWVNADEWSQTVVWKQTTESMARIFVDTVQMCSLEGWFFIAILNGAYGT